LLDYAMRDVEVTWACYQTLTNQYAELGLDKPAHRLYSEASVGKAHLAQLGIQGWRAVQPDVPDWLIATVMETYYGGRAEAHIRHLPVPGVLVDVMSEYPTVFVLQQLGSWLIGQGVDWTEEAPAKTMRWLKGLTVEKLLKPATWPHLSRLVQVRPGPQDVLPTRADYAGDGTFNLALAHRAPGGPTQWYTLADVAASFLATGHVPRILRALVFTPRAPQEGLLPLEVAGTRYLDPYRHDLVASLVELRQELKAAGDPAEAAIKATVNSVAYGIPIEVNTTPEPAGAQVLVHLPDGSSYTVKAPGSEEPGDYFHPLLATFVAGAGRLLLALVMRMVDDQGGTYAFCDTDSLFIAATETGGGLANPTGDPIELLTWQQVADIADRLVSLNPYGGALHGKSVLKIETDNFYPATGLQRQTYAWVIASKRYALYTLDQDGRPVIINDQGVARRSEHGLGHLHKPPNEPDQESFYDQWWNHLLHQALGFDSPTPDWFGLPAIGRLTLTNPQDQKALSGYNARRRYEDQIRPWGFGISATPTPAEQARTGARLVVAPFSKTPARQLAAMWVDRDHPDRSYRIRTGHDQYVIEGAVSVVTLGDYYLDYVNHPEAKADAPDGGGCRPDTIGILQPPTVTGAPILGRIGKETNRVNTDTDLTDPDDAPLMYKERFCPQCGQALRARQKWCSDACRNRSGRATRRLAYREDSVS
jgi:hypothetical protein